MVPVDADDEEELASFAPLGCGIQAGAGTVLNELKPRPGESIAVFWLRDRRAFPALMAARLAGAAPIVAIDTVRARLDLAMELGAAFTIDGNSGEDFLGDSRRWRGPVDYAVETTGRSRVIDQGHAVPSVPRARRRSWPSPRIGTSLRSRPAPARKSSTASRATATPRPSSPFSSGVPGRGNSRSGGSSGNTRPSGSTRRWGDSLAGNHHQTGASLLTGQSRLRGAPV